MPGHLPWSGKGERDRGKREAQTAKEGHVWKSLPGWKDLGILPGGGGIAK